jgi:hypothetical protein
MRKLLIAGGITALTLGSFAGAVGAEGHPGKGPSACKFFVPGTGGIAAYAQDPGFNGDENPSGEPVSFYCNPNGGYGA